VIRITVFVVVWSIHLQHPQMATGWQHFERSTPTERKFKDVLEI